MSDLVLRNTLVVVAFSFIGIVIGLLIFIGFAIYLRQEIAISIDVKTNSIRILDNKVDNLEKAVDEIIRNIKQCEKEKGAGK